MDMKLFPREESQTIFTNGGIINNSSSSPSIQQVGMAELL